MSFEAAENYLIKHLDSKRDAAMNEKASAWFADGADSYAELEKIFNTDSENTELIRARGTTGTPFTALSALGDKLSHMASIKHAVRAQFLASSDPLPRSAHALSRYVAAFSNALSYQLKVFVQNIKIRTGGTQ